MSITLGALELPADMDWPDRYDWAGVQMETRRTLGGRLVYAADTITGGRPITLASYEDGALLSQAQVNALVAMAADPDATHTLSVGGETFTVVFRWQDATPVEIRPVMPGYGEPWQATIKLLEV